MAQAETLTSEDIVRMDLDELKRTSNDIDVDPGDLDFPSMAHHMTVRGKLEALVDKDAIDYGDMEEVYERWKESKH
jgi:hypothetical protein